jgi:hypothetical protein
MFKSKYDQEFVDIVHYVNKKNKGDKNKVATDLKMKKRAVAYIIEKKKPTKYFDKQSKTVSRAKKLINMATNPYFDNSSQKPTIWQRLLGVFYKKQ